MKRLQVFIQRKKKECKGFIAGVMATVLVVTMIGPAGAALTSKMIEVYTGMHIYVDNQELKAKDNTGRPLEPILYEGTTYVPLRAISEFLGKAVDYDGTTQTVYIGQTAAKKQYMLDVCKPYQTTYYQEINELPDSRMMAGNAYTRGFILGVKNHGNGSALWNLNGQYSTFSFDFGHIDGALAGDSKCNFEVYLDGKLAYTIEGTPEMLPQHYDLDLRGALQMKVQATPAYGDFYFFANAELK